MRNSEILKIDLTAKNVVMLLILAALPNVLGMINLPTVMGFKIHTFQYAIFLAAVLYGPVGGALSGGVGSMFTAITLGNPYIAVGNIILGFMTGLFFRKGFGLIQSVLLAFAIQVPWLYLSDVYLAGMKSDLVIKIVIALTVTNLIWAVAAKYSWKKIEKVTK
jgi:uncharacterized membrane protein